MARIEQLVAGERFMGIFSGYTGTGKTIAAASFPKPMYIFDFDGRMRPIPTYYPGVTGIEFDTYGVHKHPPNEILPYGMKDMQDFRNKMETLTRSCSYKTVVLDSLTSFCMTTINHMVTSRGRAGKLLGGFKVPEMEDFGGESAVIQDTLDILKMLPCHIVLTAHWIIVETKNLKTQLTETSKQLMTGGKKIANVIPGYFDEVYNFYSGKSPVGGKVEYTVRTRGDGVTPAKTALILPDEFEFTNGNFWEIHKSLIGKTEVPK